MLDLPYWICIEEKSADEIFNGEVPQLFGFHYLGFMEELRKRWLKHGSIGCLLIGAGLSMLLDASADRVAGMAWWGWVAQGAFALVTFMSGLGFFGSAVRYLVHMDRLREREERQKRKEQSRAHK